MVEDAQAREAPVQRLADAVAGRFCFGIMAVSAATLAFWAGPGAALFPGAVEAAGLGAAGATAPYVLAARLAVDVLVVACPCALGLATPTAVLVGSSAAARRGVLIGGGDVLERLAAVDTVVLDKTGTLTQGRPRLVARRGAGEDATLALAAALESVTRHPLADAFIDAARARGLAIPSASEVTTVAGEGVWGVVDGAVTAVGRQAWVLGAAHHPPEPGLGGGLQRGGRAPRCRGGAAQPGPRHLALPRRGLHGLQLHRRGGEQPAPAREDRRQAGDVRRKVWAGVVMGSLVCFVEAVPRR
ncbi:CTP4 [Auxenochlorella protothecoides x Auxenochlorella symbiontica]